MYCYLMFFYVIWLFFQNTNKYTINQQICFLIGTGYFFQTLFPNYLPFFFSILLSSHFSCCFAAHSHLGIRPKDAFQSSVWNQTGYADPMAIPSICIFPGHHCIWRKGTGSGEGWWLSNCRGGNNPFILGNNCALEHFQIMIKTINNVMVIITSMTLF